MIKEVGEVETYEQSKSKIDIVIENSGEINIKEEHWYFFSYCKEKRRLKIIYKYL